MTCVYCPKFRRKPDQIKIVVGTNQWNSGGAIYKAEKFIVHKSYNNPKYAYDIGLIRVEIPIEFNDKVQPIKLSTKFIEPGLNLMASGWGLLNVSFFS